jgi:DNA-binding HxlR family transcriptional regulator
MTARVDHNCKAYRLAIEVLSRPWTAVILNLLQDGPLRFSEIGEGIPGLGDKVLSARLKELEGRGIVLRAVDPGPPVRVAYSLTPEGHAFQDVAAAIERWGRGLAAAADSGVA